MSGLLDTLGRAALGAAEGYGNYLVGVGQERAKAADEDRQTQRAMALERFRATVNEQQADRQMERQKGLISYTAEENRVSTGLEVRAKAAADAANDSRDFQIWKAKNGITFETWKKQQGVELSNDKAKILYEKETQARFDAQKQGLEKVGDDIAADTGTRVYTFRDPQGRIHTYDTGIVAEQKPGLGDSPLFGGTGAAPTSDKPRKGVKPGWRLSPYNSGSAAGGGAAAASTSNVLSAGEYQQAISDAQKLVKNGAPGWKGLDAAGIRKKLEDLYSSKGYALPSIK